MFSRIGNLSKADIIKGQERVINDLKKDLQIAKYRAQSYAKYLTEVQEFVEPFKPLVQKYNKTVEEMNLDKEHKILNDLLELVKIYYEDEKYGVIVDNLKEMETEIRELEGNKKEEFLNENILPNYADLETDLQRAAAGLEPVDKDAIVVSSRFGHYSTYSNHPIDRYLLAHKEQLQHGRNNYPKNYTSKDIADIIIEKLENDIFNLEF